MTVYLVCGYRGTGKDTLYHQLVGDQEFNWSIYSLDNTSSLLFDSKNLIRKAFADELKREVLNNLHLPADYPINENKNTIVEGKTLRQHLIDTGMGRRKEDANYWARQVFTNLPDAAPDKDIMVTDWRFLNEREYAERLGKKVVTIRVYRPEVDVPPIREVSEHSLDKVKTDYLLLSSVHTMSQNVLMNFARADFPQYSNYKLIN